MIVIVILSFAAVIGGIYLSASRKDERQQVLYKAEFFPVIQCDHYLPLNSPVLDNYDSISEVFIGYDRYDTPKGYIINVSCADEYGQQMHLLVGIDYESSEICGLKKLDDVAFPMVISDGQFEELKASLIGKRIPVAFTGNMVTEDEQETSRESDVVINGLHDGIYFAQSPVKDSSGYIDYVEIEIESGRVARVRWDAVNVDPTTENRSDASLSGAYRISGLDWATQSYNACHALIEVQDPDLLNMKSDGTTSIIDGVTCNIRAFVELSEECIEYASVGYRKDDYMADMDVVLTHVLRGSAESLRLINDDGFVVVSFDKNLDPFEVRNSDGVVIRLKTIRELALQYGSSEATVTPLPTRTPVSGEATPTPVPDGSSGDYIDGAEDGVINSNVQSDSNLTDSIDDLPMSEIASYIDAVPGAGPASKLAVTCVNTCYKFMKDYLNWLV